MKRKKKYSANCRKMSTSHLKILGARNVTQNKFCTDDPQIFGTTVQNLVALATWHRRRNPKF